MKAASEAKFYVSHSKHRSPSTYSLLQVVEVKPVIERAAKQGGKTQKIAECVLGDETGTVIFSARNEQGRFPQQTFPFSTLLYL